MTVKEARSFRRKISLIDRVKSGEMSVACALDRTEDLLDEEKITVADYNILAEAFENELLKKMKADYDNDDTVEPTGDILSTVEDTEEEGEE